MEKIMKYGYFDDIAREYVVTRPDTPLPWINYLGNHDYIALISNTAGGYSFYRDARLRRITRYRYNNVPIDSGGRYLYLRDRESGHFWSPTWQPVRKKLKDYSCRHGLSYTVISSETDSIHSQVRYFVPLHENLEIWDCSITNHRPVPVTLDLFSMIEFALWDALDDSSNFQRNLSTGEVEVEGSVIYHKTEYRERRDHFAYFACSAPLEGFDTQRQEFLGMYRDWSDPLVVQQGRSQNSIANGWSPIGSHHVVQPLLPGETQRIIFLLGYAENLPEEKFESPASTMINKTKVNHVIAKHLQPDQIDRAFSELNAYWDKMLGSLQVRFPNEHTNRMVNIWNAYQCLVTFNLSRSASYFESGIGRGIGFRDSNQDLLGTIHMLPERSRQRILDLAATQLENGGAFHQYQPLTKKGNHAIGSNFNDDPLWLVLSTAAYIKETGDWGILEAEAPYENQPGTEKPLYEHLQRSLDYTLDRLGSHRLPLIGRADWNDCLNLNAFSEKPGESFQTTENKTSGAAESIFIAGLFVLACREMADITTRYAGEDQSRVYKKYASTMRATILEHGWDGNWFLRAYDYYGEKIGSSSCREGQIFIEPQGFCIMADVGIQEGFARTALDSVEDMLATEHGIVLVQPAYSRYHLNLGEISSYPPGYKENAGVFCHTNPWIMIAEAKTGNGDRAFDYYLRINPSNREKISQKHRCEPYIYAQMIAGVDSPSFGEAKNSWLTGTAAWNYVAITQWILGIRPTFDGLMVDPCLPANCDGFQFSRQFRGALYEITVKVNSNGCKGRIKLVVDGKEIQGNVLPVFSDSAIHHVLAELN
jgi:cellobiose phosphorylase